MTLKNKENLMKKFAVLLSALAIATILLFGSNANITPVQAQTTCVDAAGGPIPCPPTEEPSTGGGGSEEEENEDNSGGGAQPGGGNPNPPSVVTATPSATPSPEPTNTPLPLSDKPTEDPTKNAPVFEVTPTPTGEPVIASNDQPTDPSPAPGIPWGPVGIVGVVILLMIMLLPAVQKFKNKPDAPQPAGYDAFLKIDGVPGESKGKMPSNKNPELVKNKDDDPDKAAYIRFTGIDGE